MGIKIAVSILASGSYMVINNCFSISDTRKPDIIAIILTILLAAIYFVSRKILKKGMSQILLIVISAVCGVIAYSI